MKVIGMANGDYICTLDHHELEKFLNLYYNRMERLRVGDTINLGRGHDFANEAADAMRKTQDFIRVNQAVVNAILNGLNYAQLQALPEKPAEPDVQPAREA